MPQSTANPTPEPQQTVTSPTMPTRTTAHKPQRVLACVLCQQRKVKCDRKFPCANCLRAGVHCVPANTLYPRQRRRRFPERELLERLRNYEDLLHQNEIDFEPLHPPIPTSAVADSPKSSSEDVRGSSTTVTASKHAKSRSELSREKTATKTKGAAVDLWNAISRVTVDSADENEDTGDAVGDHKSHGPDRNDAVLEKLWSNRFQAGSHDQEAVRSPVDLTTSHPEQVHIFKLWQIYLENVDPLLKITHTPTLQPRIINAAGNMAKISPALEALIFSIYCISLLSIPEDECLTLFQSSRKALLERYQSACQTALLRCHAWKSGDTEGLTAIYLYLLSVRHQTDPRSLSCMLAVAIRIAQRIGMHSESTYTECAALEAEMRRRLWWSLVIFDHRICEMSDYKGTSLVPTWDCRIPLNVNDFELRPDEKQQHSLVAHERPTEAIFSVVRSELADFVRHSTFHINFVNPALNAIARPKGARHNPLPEGGELLDLERYIEEKYIALCDVDDPLHYMTVWTARGFIARNRLLEHYSSHSTSSQRPTDAQRSAALSYALSMINCDTKLRSSPLTKKFLWYTNSNFPALAYLHFLIVLGKRPAEEHAEQAWETMSGNYDTLVTQAKQTAGDEQGGIEIFFLSYSRAIIQAWEAREALLKQQHRQSESPPRIVSDVRQKIRQVVSTSECIREEQPGNVPGGISNTENTVMPSNMPMSSDGNYAPGGLQNFIGMGPADDYPDIFRQGIIDADMTQYWTEVDWRWMHAQGW
ncbi:hypothetical protein VMCG_09183 [Cytospora schulzeri]|uniref:Zn(2)-C6 fungal-type domain-containing protein n=1 Tax=Cytospora schulzeri TaxID=448051 RepID=A0A423VLH3_9PEZI|nr:hypothetical protein VMCG_09183 [Valsa malicola]